MHNVPGPVCIKGRNHSWWADVKRILKIDAGMSSNYYLPKKGDAPDLLTTDEMFKTEKQIADIIMQYIG